MKILDYYIESRPNSMLAASATVYVAGAAMTSLSIALNPSIPATVIGITVMVIARKILLRCLDCSQINDHGDPDMTLARRRSLLDSRSISTITRSDIAFAVLLIAAAALSLMIQ